MTLAAFFAGMEVLMAFTPIGYIPMAGLSITTMHLPAAELKFGEKKLLLTMNLDETAQRIVRKAAPSGNNTP